MRVTVEERGQYLSRAAINTDQVEAARGEKISKGGNFLPISFHALCLPLHMKNRSSFAPKEQNLTKRADVFILSPVTVSCQQIKEVCSWLFSAHPSTGNSCASTFGNTAACAEPVFGSSTQPLGKAIQIMFFSNLCQFPKTALQRTQCRCRREPEKKGSGVATLALPEQPLPASLLPATPPQVFLCYRTITPMSSGA